MTRPSAVCHTARAHNRTRGSGPHRYRSQAVRLAMGPVLRLAVAAGLEPATFGSTGRCTSDCATPPNHLPLKILSATPMATYARASPIIGHAASLRTPSAQRKPPAPI